MKTRFIIFCSTISVIFIVLLFLLHQKTKINIADYTSRNFTDIGNLSNEKTPNKIDNSENKNTTNPRSKLFDKPFEITLSDIYQSKDLIQGEDFIIDGKETYYEKIDGSDTDFITYLFEYQDMDIIKGLVSNSIERKLSPDDALTQIENVKSVSNAYLRKVRIEHHHTSLKARVNYLKEWIELLGYPVSVKFLLHRESGIHFILMLWKHTNYNAMLTVNDFSEKEQPIVLTIYESNETDDINMQKPCLLDKQLVSTKEISLYINQLLKSME